MKLKPVTLHIITKRKEHESSAVYFLFVQNPAALPETKHPTILMGIHPFKWYSLLTVVKCCPAISQDIQNTPLQIVSFGSPVTSLSVSSTTSIGDYIKPDRLRATIPDILLASNTFYKTDLKRRLISGSLCYSNFIIQGIHARNIRRRKVLPVP